jgi:hypothetical protein
MAGLIAAQTGIPAGVIAAWANLEHGTTDVHAMGNNPMNIMYNATYMPKGTTRLSNGIASFPSMQAGIATTAMYLNKFDNYKFIRDAVAKGDSPQQLIAAIGQSNWDTPGTYGGKYWTGHYQESPGNVSVPDGPAGTNLLRMYQKYAALDRQLGGGGTVSPSALAAALKVQIAPIVVHVVHPDGTVVKQSVGAQGALIHPAAGSKNRPERRRTRGR